ncbi:MAG: TetR/AcrR family transcriptional regulator [Acidimicrobiia bacterium]|nr:TetR/AcrR family transcriptional regulator [Acidimicrobiia bacterium]
MTAAGTSARILDASMDAFGSRGFEATSLDDIARALGIRKQTILYWFPSKDALLDACLDLAAVELATELGRTLAVAPDGWPRVQALVRKAFRLAARRPALVGLLREADRLGPPASTRLVVRLAPLVERAQGWLAEEMEAGRLRRHDPDAVVLAAYSMLTGLASEVETQRALGMATSLRALVRRERAVERLLRAALELPRA